jgi:hypothetical protein
MFIWKYSSKTTKQKVAPSVTSATGEKKAAEEHQTVCHFRKVHQHHQM